MIQPPFGLKTKWHDALRPLAEEWVGLELEDTDLYGFRKYTMGAKLVKHVDREVIVEVPKEIVREVVVEVVREVPMPVEGVREMQQTTY